jgi:hypothetical protein
MPVSVMRFRRSASGQPLAELDVIHGRCETTAARLRIPGESLGAVEPGSRSANEQGRTIHPIPMFPAHFQHRAQPILMR